MKSVVVAGDVMVDHHLYEGERILPTMDNKRGVSETVQLGGAASIEELLIALFEAARQRGEEVRKSEKKRYGEAVASGEQCEPPKYRVLPEENYSVRLGITTPLTFGPVCPHHAFAVWRPFPKAGKDNKSAWRAHLMMGYGHETPPPALLETKNCPDDHKPALRSDNPSPTILILDDAGYRFRHRDHQDCWLLPQRPKPLPEWIVLKMSGPVAQGDLFTELQTHYADRVVCLVAAHELRRECVGLSKSLSWEQTVEDLCRALQVNPILSRLANFRHLIVTFGLDGALWLDNTNPQSSQAWLICDAGGAEGEFAADIKGDAFGYHSVLVVAIARALAVHLESDPKKRSPSPDLQTALAAGLTAKRDLRENGHGEVGDMLPNGFPTARLVAALDGPNGAFSRIPVEWPIAFNAADQTWRIVESTQRALHSAMQPSLFGLATQVVLNGTDVLKRVPHAKFGDLFTADRREMESLRAIRQQMREYRESAKAAKPLSIGVFGPPGAGKSFGVREIAKSVFGKEAWLEFNLSQFADTRDLIGAFHRVRDVVLSGITPVVFWDEFDSQEYKWLQYLLAPMQDGRFQDGQLNHAVGKSVFVFAGGTSSTYDDFGPSKLDADAQRTFKLCKGPDFHSRLDAYYDVLGPNQRRLSHRDEPPTIPPAEPASDLKDVCFPLRRAILIRAKLKCSANERLDIDPDLVEALLRVPDYKHGARSLEKLVTGLRDSDHPIRRSALPPRIQLAMHVDADCFAKLLDERQTFRLADVVENIAKAIHETWRKLSKQEGWQMQPPYDMPYDALGPVEKEENRAAARRIPEVLGLVGLALEPATSENQRSQARQAELTEHLEHHIELLAEAEHDGWMAHRFRNGWHHGEIRDDAKKIHNALVPYATLTEIDKNKDRNSVRKFPEMVTRADYQIMFLGEATKAVEPPKPTRRRSPKNKKETIAPRTPDRSL